MQIGAGLVAAGLVVGPSVGHFYANAERQAGLGVGIRGGAVLVGGAALSIIAVEVIANSVAFVLFPFASRDYELSRTSQVAGNVATGAGIVMAGSILFDIVTAPLSAYQFNEANNLRVQVAPRVSPTLDQAGLAVHLRF